MEWKPIETAIKGDDCEPIILGFAADEEGYSPSSREGFWSEVRQRWMLWSDPTWDSSPQPTHWMPLPSPPKQG